MKHLLILSTALFAHICVAAEPLDLDTDTAKTNYSVGYQIGGDFKLEGLEMQPEVVIRGIQDALSDATPLMTPEEMRTTMGELGKRKAEKSTREKYMAKIQYEKDAVEFLAANAKKEGVVTTASGLQYKVIEAGTGRTPKATDTVTVNYRGTFIDGKEFDSSYKRGEPTSFPLNRVIPCWTEGVQRMKPGGKAKLTCPPAIAYGAAGAGGVIPPNATLNFEIELISVGR